MIKVRLYYHGPFVLTLAVLWAGGRVCAQELVSLPNASLAIIAPKQATGLILAQAAPEYPAVAKVNYLQGHVQLELTVNGKGEVADAHVLDGDAILAVAALKAARGWNYQPLTTAAGRSGFVTRVKIKFTLNYHGINLTPRQAELDFLRQVKPPQVVQHPEDAPSEDVVHMRLLVNDQGQVVDKEISHTGQAQFAAAREILRRWTFHPAQWGSLPIAAYLDVDVPVSASSLARAVAESGSR